MAYIPDILLISKTMEEIKVRSRHLEEFMDCCRHGSANIERLHDILRELKVNPEWIYHSNTVVEKIKILEGELLIIQNETNEIVKKLEGKIPPPGWDWPDWVAPFEKDSE